MTPDTPDGDRDNPTYTARLSTLYTEDGRFAPDRRHLYDTPLERLRAHGLRPTDRILDVGVGYGGFLALLTELGFESTFGLDPFPQSIEIASQYSGAHFEQGRIEDASWPYDDASFDAITCFQVIEHLEQPSVFFERAARYLKPGGLVLATTPLKELGYRMRRIPWLGRPDRNPTHINVQPPRWWLEVARDSPLELVESWRGDHLSHIKLVSVFGTLARLFGMDHRKIPLLRQFEASFAMILRRRPAP